MENGQIGQLAVVEDVRAAGLHHLLLIERHLQRERVLAQLREVGLHGERRERQHVLHLLFELLRARHALLHHRQRVGRQRLGRGVVALAENRQRELLPGVVLARAVHEELVRAVPVRGELLGLLVDELAQQAEVLLHEVVGAGEHGVHRLHRRPGVLPERLGLVQREAPEVVGPVRDDGRQHDRLQLDEAEQQGLGHRHAHLAAGVAIAVANALHLVETSDERIEKREKTRSAARRGSESRGTRRPRGSDSRSFRSRSCGPTLESESTSKRRS